MFSRLPTCTRLRVNVTHADSYRGGLFLRSDLFFSKHQPAERIGVLLYLVSSNASKDNHELSLTTELAVFETLRAHSLSLTFFIIGVYHRSGLAVELRSGVVVVAIST